MAARPESKNSLLSRIWISKAIFHVAVLFSAFMLAYELRRYDRDYVAYEWTGIVYYAVRFGVVPVV